MKQVINRFSNLKSFFSDLEVLISCLRQERDSRISNILVKRQLCPYPPGSAHALNMYLLTPYAYQIVVEQINQTEKVKFPSDTPGAEVVLKTNIR